MSEETKEEVKVEEKKVDVVDAATVAESQLKPEAKEEVDDHDDIFITEEDTFDIEVVYFVKDREIHVKDYDDVYDSEGQKEKVLKVTFKYPDLRDTEAITSSESFADIRNASYADIAKVENVRMHME